MKSLGGNNISRFHDIVDKTRPTGNSIIGIKVEARNLGLSSISGSRISHCLGHTYNKLQRLENS